MSTIILGAQTAAPTPARSESKGATGDTGAAGFGAALADAMAPERPAAGVGRGHGKHSAQPKTDAVKDDSATAACDSTPTDASTGADAPTVDATTVAPQIPAPTAIALSQLAAMVSAAPVPTTAEARTESVPVPPSVRELVEGPGTGASTSSATVISATVASAIVTGDAAATLETLAAPVSATPATAGGSPAISAATTSAAANSVPAIPAKPAAKGSAATPVLASSGATTPATGGTTGSVAGPVTPVSAPATPVPAVPASVTQDAAPVLPQTTPPLAAQAVTAVPGSIRDERAPKAADASVSGAAGAAPVAAAQGVQAATSATPATPAQAPAPTNAPTFTAQLAKPLFTLATGPAGDHIVTVKVTPENLGPVTVRAHIGADGVRMELFAPSDAGREALRSILTDLRRDLASQGASANLDLSSQNQPTDSGDRGARQGASALPDRQTSSVIEPEIATVRRDYGPMSSLDVLA